MLLEENVTLQKIVELDGKCDKMLILESLNREGFMGFRVNILAEDGSFSRDENGAALKNYSWFQWSVEDTMPRAMAMVETIEECCGASVKRIEVVDSADKGLMDRHGGRRLIA